MREFWGHKLAALISTPLFVSIAATRGAGPHPTILALGPALPIDPLATTVLVVVVAAVAVVSDVVVVVVVVVADSRRVPHPWASGAKETRPCIHPSIPLPLLFSSPPLP